MTQPDVGSGSGHDQWHAGSCGLQAAEKLSQPTLDICRGSHRAIGRKALHHQAGSGRMRRMDAGGNTPDKQGGMSRGLS